MSETPLPDAESVPLALRINRACDRFEAAWKAGAAPGIEGRLDGWAEPERSALARELILLDLYYRRGRGAACRAEDYLARFPLLDRDWLAAALADGGPTPGAPPTPPEESANGSPTTTGPPRPAGPLPANLRSFGDYEVLEEIARGGMGVVGAFVGRPLR